MNRFNSHDWLAALHTPAEPSILAFDAGEDLAARVHDLATGWGLTVGQVLRDLVQAGLEPPPPAEASDTLQQLLNAARIVAGQLTAAADTLEAARRAAVEPVLPVDTGSLTLLQRKILEALAGGPLKPKGFPRELYRDKVRLHRELAELLRRGLILRDKPRGHYRLPG